MVYVTGDTHGDIGRFANPALKKLKEGDTLIICGDFGFLWDGSKAEQKALKQLAKKKYTICFLDGTHENFEMLRQYEIGEWNGGKAQHICGNVYHLMRGQLYRVDDITIFTMGGGESPDLEYRYENDSWSREEIPTREELLEGAANLERAGYRVDVIVTHEPPAQIKGFLKLPENGSVRVTALNTYFEELSESCAYTKWFFGSMHVDKYVSSNQVAVFKNVLDCLTGRPVRK